MFFKRNKVINNLPETKKKELYRQVFSTPQGTKVLTDILIDLCFFDEIEDDNKVTAEEQMYLNNAAKKILNKCGVYQSKNVELITKALIKMPIK